MYDELRLPDTRLARAAWDHARDVLPEYLFNHSVRAFLYAREIGRDTDYDAEVLFLGCVLHDLGLTVSTGQRFEVDGADAARRFLADNDAAPDTAEVVWQAIALHTSIGIAGRMRPEIALVQAGSGADVIGLPELPARVRATAEGHLPWLDLATSITEAIVDRALTEPSTAPPLSFPGQVLAEWTGAKLTTWRELVDSGLDKRRRLV